MNEDNFLYNSSIFVLIDKSFYENLYLETEIGDGNGVPVAWRSYNESDIIDGDGFTIEQYNLMFEHL